MWHNIDNQNDLTLFLETVWNFHDCCVKEMSYLSGAYVNSNFAMHPVNDVRTLRVIIQSQNSDVANFQIEFQKLKYLRLIPIDEYYTCEILDATMLLTEEGVFWCDCGGVNRDEMDQYDGTVICAQSARWRFLKNGEA